MNDECVAFDLAITGASGSIGTGRAIQRRPIAKGHEKRAFNQQGTTDKPAGGTEDHREKGRWYRGTNEGIHTP